jgi:hypothetical protein
MRREVVIALPVVSQASFDRLDVAALSGYLAEDFRIAALLSEFCGEGATECQGTKMLPR